MEETMPEGTLVVDAGVPEPWYRLVLSEGNNPECSFCGQLLRDATGSAPDAVTSPELGGIHAHQACIQPQQAPVWVEENPVSEEEEAWRLFCVRAGAARDLRLAYLDAKKALETAESMAREAHRLAGEAHDRWVRLVGGEEDA